MTKKLLLFILNYFLMFKTSHAQHSNQCWPNAPTVANPKAPNTPEPIAASPPIFDRIPAKCYPETATAYFLPAPPSSPKVTVLDPTLKNVSPDMKQNLQEIISNRNNPDAFPPPPPPCLTGLPDLMDEIPSKIQDRFSRLAKSKEESKVCESCSSLLKKLPIFNFDQELLEGFLAGIGL